MFDYLKINGYKHTIREWTEIINKKYNENYSKKQMNEYFVKNKINFKYEKHFKVPIGTERKAKNHDIQIKIAEPNKWIYKKRYLYEKYNGVKLTKNDIIIHLDNNKNNFNKDNLYKINKKEHLYMLNYELQSSNPQATLVGISSSKLMVKSKERKDKLKGEL